MKPQRIILVRHGQSVGNIDKQIYKEIPDYSVPLTVTGHTQAQQVGKHLAKLIGTEPVHFYYSPFWRTRQTMLNIAEELPTDRMTFYEDPRLREQEWGQDLVERKGVNWEGEKARDAYGHFYWRFPDGESCADVYDRMSDFMGTMFRDFKKQTFPKNCIIVTHGMAMRCFMMRFFHATVEEFESWANPKNCEHLLLEIGDDERYRLIGAMKLHKVRHEYQFDWNRYTSRFRDLGMAKVPYEKIETKNSVKFGYV